MTVTTVEATESTAQETTLDHIGVEFEYPVGAGVEHPWTQAATSTALRNEIGRGEDWDIGEPEIPMGTMTSDHVGAEITSGIMDLHSTQPEVWYFRSIQKAEDLGYPFAACGWGDTNFGLHMHLSPLDSEKREAVADMVREPWARVFFCTSLSATSADPFRHGGVGPQGVDPGRVGDYNYTAIPARTYGERNHYEFRFPEPMLPNHFGMVMHFLRLLDVEGVDTAEEYASDSVYDKDPSLTAVQQYRYYVENVDGWLEEATREDRRTDSDAALWFVDLMDE